MVTRTNHMRRLSAATGSCKSSCLWCYDVIPHWFVPRVTVILMHFNFATAATTSLALISTFDRYQKQKDVEKSERLRKIRRIFQGVI